MLRPVAILAVLVAAVYLAISCVKSAPSTSTDAEVITQCPHCQKIQYPSAKDLYIRCEGCEREIRVYSDDYPSVRPDGTPW